MYRTCEKNNFDINGFKKTLRLASLAILGGFQPMKVLPFVTNRYPQMTSDGNINYLLASGLAIQKYTNQLRKHRDIDFVLTTEQIENEWHALKVDLNVGSAYWCLMNLSNDFLCSTANEVDHLWLVNSAILMVQKSSNHKNLPPRSKDNWDADNLAKYCIQKQLFSSDEWIKVLNTAIASLPFSEQPITRRRIDSKITISKL